MRSDEHKKWEWIDNFNTVRIYSFLLLVRKYRVHFRMREDIVSIGVFYVIW